jgi:signal transduction histidine kinase
VVVKYYQNYQKNREHPPRDVEKLNLISFFDLQAKQLADRDPIFFTRIVFYCTDSKNYQEIISYDRDITRFDGKFVNYLKSEQWLTEYPEVFTVNQIDLGDPQLFSYLCPWGYQNNRPEYILAIANQPLSSSLQVYLQGAAILTEKYREIYLNWREQKLESQVLQDIIQNISHQLRNSLGLISLHAKNLWFVLKDRQEQSQAQVICDSIQDLDLSLTESIDCSRSQIPRLVPQDLRQLVDESLNKLQPAIEQKHLKVSISETSTMLTVDRLQMQQVFDNLLSNAVHFSPLAGTITCSWQIFQSEVSIQISDEGCGLSPEDLQKIFNPFYSRRAGGTGLGLTIAKKIVIGHHGSLWAQNVRSGGARFSLILPISA